MRAISFPDTEERVLIDGTAGGFGYLPGQNLISPLTIHKDWRKADIVALYNARKAPGAPAYAPNLSNRKRAQVLADVFELLTRS